MMNTMKANFEERLAQLDVQEYLKTDPISVVRELAEKPNITTADIEIGAIWTAMVSWGAPTSSIKAARKILDMCEWEPAKYVRQEAFYWIPDDAAIYRTIKGDKFKAVNRNLKMTYDAVDCVADYANKNMQTINQILADLTETLEPAKLGSPARNSSCKRINQLLRWMVRKDDIDLGLWASPFAQPSDLYAIVDKETAKAAKIHNLISYADESWNAVLELTFVYKNWDMHDPLKYDLVKNELSNK